MKKIIIAALAALVALILAFSVFAAAGPDDFQAIQKAVKANPNAVPGKEPHAFRVEVSDVKTGKVDVQITLPIAVIDIISRCVEGESLHIREHGCNIDLKELFRELKALGPTMFLEVTDHDQHVRLWLE